jgi:hypothetical protein
LSVQWYIASILDGMGKALQPLADALDSAEAFGGFLAGFGYESLATDIQEFGTTFTALTNAYDALTSAAAKVETLRQVEDPELSDILPAVKDLGVATANLIAAIDGLKNIAAAPALPAPLDDPTFWSEFPLELADSLLHRYLESEQPRVFGLFTLFGILSADVPDPQSLSPGRRPYLRRQVHWDRLGLIVSRPDNLMSEVYGFGQTFEHGRLIQNLTILANAFDFPAAQTELSPAILNAYFGGTPQPSVRQLLAPIFWDAVESNGGYAYSSLDLIVAPIPPAGNAGAAPSGFTFFPVLEGHAGTAIDIVPNVTASLEGGFQSAGAIRLEVRPDGPEIVVPQTLGLEIGATAALTVGNQTPLILFGDKKSSRFEIDKLQVTLAARGPVTDLEYRFGIAIQAARLLVFLNEADGFLKDAMPKEALKIELDFNLGWSSKSGFVFGGGAAIEATLPVHLDLFGVLKIDSVYLALMAKGQATGAFIELVAATSASLELGPVLASVDQIGMSARLTFPEGGGNLGPANLSFGFKPPRGVGFLIDASAVVGGGFLFFDVDRGQYGGVLQLEVKGGISIKAIGLITTIMPDGTPGFSLLIIIAVEFSPIQLGYGFTLNGVGGLFGFNRTMKVDPLRDGIKNRTLDSIMFPPNPVANAQKIISDLQTIFPPAIDRFVFAPMVKFGWGSGILLIEVGLIVELPSPLRLAIIGKLHVKLPPIDAGEGEESKNLVELHLDVLGILDFDRGEISVDAVLYNSRIVVLPITGGMAMRLRWGANPVFLMAIGGLNPRFPVPPGFPTVDRLGINLSYDGNGLKACLRLETYLAVTANSLQFGARLEARAELSVAKVAGFMGFDALIEFSPFYFIVDIYGGVVVEAFGLGFNVGLLLTLSGPSPFLGEGMVSVDFLGKHEIPIRFVIGEEATDPPLPPVDPLPELLAAFKDPRNWSATVAEGTGRLVTIRQLTTQESANKLLAHPLGELTVRQKVLPFGIALGRFGAGVPTTPGPFDVATYKLGNRTAAQPPSDSSLRDDFARGQFLNLTEDEKVSGPGFESFRCGHTRIGTDAITYPATAAQHVTFDYDVSVIDNKESRISRDLEPVAIDREAFLRGAQSGAASRTPMTATGSAKFAGRSKGITVRTAQYKVADRENLATTQSTDALDSYDTYTEATAAKRRGGDAGQVVEAYEVA